MKFDMMMRINSANIMGNKKLKILKSKMADSSYLDIQKIAISPKLFGQF